MLAGEKRGVGNPKERHQSVTAEKEICLCWHFSPEWWISSPKCFMKVRWMTWLKKMNSKCRNECRAGTNIVYS